jgi:hypothetical protein
MRLPKQTKTVRIPVPFEMSEEIGLGDAVKRLTTKVGLRPCAPCEERAATLNRYLVFTGRPADRG